MRQKRKISRVEMTAKKRGQQLDNIDVASLDLQQQIVDQLGAELSNEDIPTSPLSNGNMNSSSSSNDETRSKQKQKQKQKQQPVLVKVRDISTGEITSRRMQPYQVWYLEKNKKVTVEINGDGQGCDNGSNLLVRFLGKLSQNSTICPISVERWDRMPDSNSRQQWQIIEDKFEFDYVAGIKWVLNNLSDRWRGYKHTLRRKYLDSNKNTEELLANPPTGVDCIEWAAFVQHYTDRKMKAQRLQNSINRQKLKVSHTGGSKSNARRGREMEQELGRPVCRGEVVLSTLQKKDGSYVNEDAKMLADKISEHLPQDQERAATSGVPLKILAHPDDAIWKSCGPDYPGRVRGLGMTASRSIDFGSPRHATSYANDGGSSDNTSQERVKDLEKEVESLKEKLAGHEETKQQLAQAQNQLEIVNRFLQAKFGSELLAFSQDFS